MRARGIEVGVSGCQGRSVSVLSPAPRDAWSAIWEASPEATVFHTPEWFDACCQAGGFRDVSRLYVTVDGARIVVPLVQRQSSRRRWRTSSSLPVEWGFGGAFAERAVAAEDIGMILQDLLGASARLIVNPGPVNSRAWATIPARARIRHDAHTLDLRQGFDSLWLSVFSRGTRNKVRKAEKEGVEIQWAPASEMLHVHDDLFLRWTKQRAKERGIPVQVAIALAKRREPRRRYEAIARHLGESCQVIVARVDGQPAASVIALLKPGGAHAHYWRSASDKALVHGRHANANYLLMTRMLERMAGLGCQFVHMGESGGIRSLMDFKERFGARPVSYDELRFEPILLTNALRAQGWVLHTARDLAVRAVARVQTTPPSLR